MKPATKVALAGAGVLVLAGAVGPLGARTAHPPGDHRIVTPQEVRWSPAPPSLRPEAEVAVLYGDPGGEGPFAMRLRMPANHAIAPHTHSGPEIVTVISGTFHLGMGEAADRGKARALPAGSFFAFPPGMGHYAFTDAETVVQINTAGPWGITYIATGDDPRRQSR